MPRCRPAVAAALLLALFAAPLQAAEAPQAEPSSPAAPGAETPQAKATGLTIQVLHVDDGGKPHVLGIFGYGATPGVYRWTGSNAKSAFNPAPAPGAATLSGTVEVAPHPEDRCRNRYRVRIAEAALAELGLPVLKDADWQSAAPVAPGESVHLLLPAGATAPLAIVGVPGEGGSSPPRPPFVAVSVTAGSFFSDCARARFGQ